MYSSIRKKKKKVDELEKVSQEEKVYTTANQKQEKVLGHVLN